MLIPLAKLAITIRSPALGTFAFDDIPDARCVTGDEVGRFRCSDFADTSVCSITPTQVVHKIAAISDGLKLNSFIQP